VWNVDKTVKTMRTTTTIPLLAALLLTASLSCLEEDPLDISPIFESKIVAEGDIRDSMLRFEEEYGVAFEWSFLESDYSPVGLGLALPCTRVSDYAGVLEMAKFIEREVFARFPPGFIKEYMPRNVFLVDSLISVYTHNDEVKGEQWEKPRSLTCNLTNKYVVIGNVNGFRDSALTPAQEAYLREELISLFVENLFNNNRIPPIPNAFKAATEKACDDAGVVITMSVNYPWWEVEDGFYTWSGVGADSAATPWLGYGILKSGRMGLYAYSHRVVMSIDSESYSIHRATMAQDFADFTTFILLNPPDVREAYYGEVASITKVYTYPGYPPDPRWPYGGTAGAEAMRTKDGVVKAYWKENFGITLE
jgi:hypothetical protein